MAREQRPQQAQRPVAPEVTPQEQPAVAPAIETPAVKSDRYRVKGPGGIFANGRLNSAGEILQLSDSDALEMFDLLEQI